uniref:Phospholipid-transporting ATPase n=1 Tax=Compsopogon caeruleus TaxID=31354 RepID=A0A7S1TBX7_9RHOD|mmetsp:Transcript_15850/g.31810  ORF Transcript_15850/g.31810 Transcript_15850/m.31810 type:complete len:1203 (+) Transcript_15850:70-3678(+)
MHFGSERGGVLVRRTVVGGGGGSGVGSPSMSPLSRTTGMSDEDEGEWERDSPMLGRTGSSSVATVGAYRSGRDYYQRLNQLRGASKAIDALTPSLHEETGMAGATPMGDSHPVASPGLLSYDDGLEVEWGTSARIQPSPGSWTRRSIQSGLIKRWFAPRRVVHEERTLRIGGDSGAGQGYSGFGSSIKWWWIWHWIRRRRKGENAVCNTKYNMISFLPFVLYDQFKLFYNLFFLLIAMSQLVPALRVGMIWSYFGPLCFVLLISMSKEAVDEFHRAHRDREINDRLYTLLVPDEIDNDDGVVKIQIRAKNLRVGDVIEVEANERIPADLVLLRAYPSDGPGDSLFIRTDQLDGETDWKLRRAVHTTQMMDSEQSLLRCQDSVYAEAPRKEIYEFIGTYLKESGEKESLSLENTLWTNTVLASGKAIAMVVYVGHETRSMMNMSQPRSKIGKLDLELNFLSKLMFGLLLFLSFTLTALRGFYGQWWLYFFRYFLLLSYIIPISLRVNLDMAKIVYTYFMERDNGHMPGCIVRTTDLPEELGRVEYLLTDKTGTLTQNEMAFKKLHLGSVLFSRDSLADIRRYISQMFLAPDTPTSATGGGGRIGSLMNVGSTSGGHLRIQNHVREAVLGIALAHNVTPIEEAGARDYQAASPDEVALVKFAESVGVILRERTASSVILVTESGEELSYDVLYEFPFTSEAKRMGIIVQERDTKVVTLYVKGADTVMSGIVRFNDWLEEECGNLAREGLRTLVFGKRTLSVEELLVFEEQWKNARTQSHNRKEAMLAAQSSLERNLELIALTGVEDKLQPNVRETLEKLRHAGIRIWMLTGDKVETATCVAVSSRLAERSQGIFRITGITSRAEASRRLSVFKRNAKNDVLVVDGTSLQVYLDHFPEDFMEAASMAPAAVASRCSPTQKADVVRLLKSHTGKQVAAIGDGGNDVSMIQQANVGIGIPGKEGKQASLAADFSITTFSHLTRLFLWHGRNSYRRSARLAQFVMHRGLIISVIQMVFSALFFYAAISQYDSWILVGYATVFTMFPVFSLVLDHDVSESVALTYPELYRDLQKGRSLNLKTFLTWVFKSIYQGTAIMVLSVYFLQDDEFFTILHISAISFTALIITELLMVALEIHTWHWVMFAAEVCSLASYVAAIFLLSEVFDRSVIFRAGFLGKVVLVTLVSCLPVTIGKFLKRTFAPPAYSKVA